MQGGKHEDSTYDFGRFAGRHARVLRIWAALWAGCVLALANIGMAMADTTYQPSLAGVVQGPTPWANYNDDEYYDGYLVYGANKYDCLIYALGLNPRDFDLVARGKLDRPETGGKFYEVVQEGYNSNCPPWCDIAFYEGWLYQSGVTPGTGTNPQYLWAFNIYDDDYQQAKEDAETIRDGGDVGGGDSGGGESGGTTPTDYDYAVFDEIPDTVILKYTSKGQMVNNYETLNVIITSEAKSYIQGKNNNAQQFGFYTDGGITVHVISISKKLEYTPIQYGVQLINSNNEKIDYVDIAMPYNTQGNNYTLRPTSSWSNKSSTQQYIKFEGHYFSVDSTSSGGGTTPEPEPSPDPWPEPEPEPTTPTPPQLPDPKDPVTPNPPDPTTPEPNPDPPRLPDPSSPSLPDVPDIESGDTYTVDLQGILDAMDEHCIHIQTCLNSNFSNLDQLMTELFSIYSAAVIDQIYQGDLAKIQAIADARDYVTENVMSAISSGVDTLNRSLADMEDLFEDFTAWLDKKLDYQFPTFSDNSIVYWLKRIYYKGGTGTDSRPVDPVTDPFGIGKWLENLANTLIRALEGLAPGLVGQLLSVLDLLKTKFPFSLPWDIMAVLGAFVAMPEAPNCEIPAYALVGGEVQQVGTYDIDLDAYSGVMEGVRFVGFLGFAVYTMTLIPKWCDDLMGVVDGA